MVHPLSNPSGRTGQLSFRLLYGEVLRRVLQKARDGLLDPRWRENVARISVLSGPDPLGVHPSVVTAINEMPSAAWEPGNSPGWRAALDSWYQDSRAALAEHRGITLAQHADLTKLSASASVAARIATSPSIGEVVAQIADLDARNHDMARQSLSTFIVQRDTLTASYMAALAAGGIDVNWRSWLEDRINTWDNTLATDGARMTIRQSSSYLQRLPTYW